jgi:Domain of unknown function (DUF3303)
MLFLVIGDAKPGITLKEIKENRKSFLDWEETSSFSGQYETISRYEWVGASPKKTFWIMEADDPAIIHNLVEFFSDVWNTTTYPVVQRDISQAI